jgi:hypothetical protein
MRTGYILEYTEVYRGGKSKTGDYARSLKKLKEIFEKRKAMYKKWNNGRSATNPKYFKVTKV